MPSPWTDARLSLDLRNYDHDEGKHRLLQELTLLIHERDKAEKLKRRTGKPEDSATITYRYQYDARACDRALLSKYATIQWTIPPNPTTYILYISDFWQQHLSVTKPIWPASQPPQRMVVTNGTRHPRRHERPVQSQLLYERYIPRFSTTFSLKVVSLAQNLQDFCAWHNSDRVNAFWGQRGTIAEQKAYLTNLLEAYGGTHVIPVIGYFGSTPFAYFELYHALEDAIAPFASPDLYDVGFHALVGNEAFRGPERVEIWIASVTHYLFLADSRTQRVMLEPRVDNEKFITYLTKSGYVVEKEFNFPHKRAALVSITREKFFEVQGVAT